MLDEDGCGVPHQLHRSRYGRANFKFTISICPRAVVATAVTRVTDSGSTATNCITANPIAKYTLGDAKSDAKYMVYDMPAFGE